MAVINQKITNDYAIYNSDCMEILPEMKDNSIDFSVYSPPFAGLYNYSSSDNDFSNCPNKEAFLGQYEYLIKEVCRVTKPGRLTAVHCQHVPEGYNLWHFPKFIHELHEKYGMHFFDERYIWKEPLIVAIRTRAQGLTHKWIVKDSTKCRSALADIIMIFKKGGENKAPVTHEYGLDLYAGSDPVPKYMQEKYGFTWEEVVKKYKGWKEPKTNKRSHVIWQRYASVFWDDIRLSNKAVTSRPNTTQLAVLDYKEARDPDDEKHVHPLQLDVISRLVTLYSNSGETVLTPFMGVGSEVYGAVMLNRKGIGIELKESYYRQAVKNLAEIKKQTNEQTEMVL